MRKGVHEAFQDLVQYMDAQRFPTPRGLDWLRNATSISDQNLTLLAMQQLFPFHATMWTEGVWEIVNAGRSPTRFLLSDEPVTFFNAGVFPGSRECAHPKDASLGDVGTRTLFPLGMDKCLIITHVQLVRDPWANPKRSRVNARAYQQTIADLRAIQFGRDLSEEEVLRINYILKKRATRYIAAIDEEWLYPEWRLSTTHWSKLDQDWFLLPHLWKVKFSAGIAVGYAGGRSWAMDEYGRSSRHPEYEDKQLRDREWILHLKARKEWAMRRRGRSVAHVDKSDHDEVGDQLMEEFLAKERQPDRAGHVN
jgi:hypothetical protein